MNAVFFLWWCFILFIVVIPVKARDHKNQYFKKNVAIYESPIVKKPSLLNQAVEEINVTTKAVKESIVTPSIADSLKREMITAFTADIALISRIIVEGESNEQEREQFSGIFAKQLQWFSDVLEKTTDQEDSLYKSALAKKALIKMIVRHQEQADEILYARAKMEKYSQDFLRRARLLLLYDLNSRMQAQTQKALTAQEIEVLVADVCKKLVNDQKKSSNKDLLGLRILRTEEGTKEQQEKELLIKKMSAEQARCTAQIVELTKKVFKNEEQIAVLMQKNKELESTLQKVTAGVVPVVSVPVIQNATELSVQQKEEKNKKELELLLLGQKK